MLLNTSTVEPASSIRQLDGSLKLTRPHLSKRASDRFPRAPGLQRPGFKLSHERVLVTLAEKMAIEPRNVEVRRI